MMEGFAKDPALASLHRRLRGRRSARVGGLLGGSPAMILGSVAAIGALRSFATKRSAVRDLLLDLLRDPYLWARGEAADVLGDAGDPAALEGLRDLAARDADGRIRRRARAAIRKIEGRDPAAQERETRRIDRIALERADLEARVAELEREVERLLEENREMESRLRDQRDRVRALEEVGAGSGGR